MMFSIFLLTVMLNSKPLTVQEEWRTTYIRREKGEEQRRYFSINAEYTYNGPTNYWIDLNGKTTELTEKQYKDLTK